MNNAFLIKSIELLLLQEKILLIYTKAKENILNS